MATLMQAVERVRNDGQLPVTGQVSLRDLHARFPPGQRGSLRSVQDQMFQGAAKKPWAIILCRFKNEPADPAREGPIEQFYRGAFTKGTGGLVEFWRDASLGKLDVSGSRVFGWIEVDLERSKANVGSGQNRSTLVDTAIAAARRDGHDPITGFHSQLSVYIENWSMSGAPPGADWSHPTWGQFWIDGSADGRGKVSLTPPHTGNIVAHEMGHSFGMDHDLGADLVGHYMDPCCIMSQNNAFIQQPWNVAFGPAICTSHLSLHGWMYPRRLYVDAGGWMNEPDGISLPLATLTDPAARATSGSSWCCAGPGRRGTTSSSTSGPKVGTVESRSRWCSSAARRRLEVHRRRPSSARSWCPATPAIGRSSWSSAATCGSRYSSSTTPVGS